MRWIRPALLVVVSLVAGCIIIADPDFQPPEPVPIPIPTPPEFVPIPFPTPGGAGTTIFQAWFVRLDPGSSALAPSYTSMLNQAKAAFEASGAQSKATVVFALQDARPLWATSWVDGGTPPVSLEETLRYYAAHPWDSGVPDCSAKVIYNALRDMQNVRVTYPLELVPFVPPDAGAPPDAGEDAGVFDAGEIIPIPHSLWPYHTPNNAVFIAVVDSGPRAFGYTDQQCLFGTGVNQRSAARAFTEGLPVNWIRSGEQRFEPAQVAWMLAATSEDAGSSAMKSRCLARPNFPKNALDVISASPRALYTPWEADSVSHPSVVQYSDFCEAAAGDWSFGLFVNRWAMALTPVGPVGP